MAVLGLLSGCGDRTSKSAPPQPIEIGSVGLSYTDSRTALLSASTFEELTRAAMTGLWAPSGYPPLGKLIVEGAWIAGEADQAQLAVSARLRLSSLPFRLEANVVAGGAAPNVEAANQLTASAVVELRAAVARHLSLLEAGPDRLIRGLDAAEADEQVLSARLLGERRERRAVAAVIRLLGDPREPVADAAADALMKIGDPAAVPLVIASIKRGDLRSEVRAIEIIAHLGGSEARSYLEMTAAGHPHPEVQQLSRQFLERLNRGKN